MDRRWPRRIGVSAFCALALAAMTASATIRETFSVLDATGVMSTVHTGGPANLRNAFFQSLGTNGRSCATCHTFQNALSLGAADARARYAATRGRDPLFADVDGANCRGAAPGDRSAHSLILGHGLIRVGLPVPAHAQFTIQAVYDPYGCADAADPTTGVRSLSVYRRPLPATNLRFLSAVMFDGRDTVAPLNAPATFAANLVTDLTQQALEATLGHAQAAAAPTARQLAEIVDFEVNLFSAQSWDRRAGSLRAGRARGGPLALARQEYYPGINDSLGGNPTGAAFDPDAFSIFAPWESLQAARQDRAARDTAAIAAGERLFNTFPLTITAVAGLNDALDQASIPGTCTTCHDAPNVGDHSLPVPLDIGVSHSTSFETDPRIAAGLSHLSLPDLPIFKVTCTAVAPERTIYTTDPGRALITGSCADLTRGKGPILRGLAARAPYFHNGAAATLQEVVDFYNDRFEMNLTDTQKQQLVAFLQSL